MKKDMLLTEPKQFAGKADAFPTQCFLKPRLVVSVSSAKSMSFFTKYVRRHADAPPHRTKSPGAMRGPIYGVGVRVKIAGVIRGTFAVLMVVEVAENISGK